MKKYPIGTVIVVNERPYLDYKPIKNAPDGFNKTMKNNWKEVYSEIGIIIGYTTRKNEIFYDIIEENVKKYGTQYKVAMNPDDASFEEGSYYDCNYKIFKKDFRVIGEL